MTLPTPENPVVVVEGDCARVFDLLGDGAVAHVISDPPFAEKTHKGARTGQAGAQTLIDFSSITTETYVALVRECCRVARRWVVLSSDWRHAAVLEDETPDLFVRLGVWVKPNPTPQFTGDRPGTGWEAVAVLHRPGVKKWNGGGASSVWTHNKPSDTHGHPTCKPVPLIREWLRDFTDQGDLIFDPFGGSGTTAVACLYEGRLCLTCERDPRHAATIRARVADVRKSGGLVDFRPRATPRPRPPALVGRSQVLPKTPPPSAITRPDS